MPLQNVNSKPLILLSTVLSLQITSYIIVLLDIPVARQVLLSAYLTFVPGYLIIKLFRFNFEPLEVLVFSVGFSVAFLMLVGLALNELGFSAGLSQPLSTIPMLIALNMIILAVTILAYLRNEASSLPRVSFRLLKWIMPLLVPLVLSVVGAVFVGVYGDNRLLLVMILAVSLVTAFLTLKSEVPSAVYTFAVFIISISLLFHSLLVSKYIVSLRSDSPSEYLVSKITESNAYWSYVFVYPNIAYGRIYSMLSVTILPTIYSDLLNMDTTWVYKILYPLVFSFVPLALYKLWQKHLGAKRSFIATFLLMAQNTFYTEMVGLNRQMIAELFFVLLLYVILSKEINTSKKNALFIILSFALVTSHYALAEIFFFFISFTCIFLILMKRNSRNITINLVVLFFAMMFVWYLYTCNAAVFESFVSYGNYVYDQLDEFFNPASRGPMVLAGLGLESPPTVWNMLSRMFAYLTEVLIVFGFIGLITKRANMRLEREHLVLIVVAGGLLGALILVPGLAQTMNMTRFYHVLLFFLAPLCVLGAEFLVRLVCKRPSKFIITSILLLVILIPYFLFQVNFVYEVSGSQSWSLPLSKHRMDLVSLRVKMGYFDESEVLSALWMSKIVDVKTSKTYADYSSAWMLLNGYGMIYGPKIEVLSNVTSLLPNSYIYLNKANIIDDILVGSNALWNTSSISQIFDFSDKVYSNGMCDIYKCE